MRTIAFGLLMGALPIASATQADLRKVGSTTYYASVSETGTAVIQLAHVVTVTEVPAAPFGYLVFCYSYKYLGELMGSSVITVRQSQGTFNMLNPDPTAQVILKTLMDAPKPTQDSQSYFTLVCSGTQSFGEMTLYVKNGNSLKLPTTPYTLFLNPQPNTTLKATLK